MSLNDFYFITDWFRIQFTENEGMAFGLKIGGEYGKLALSIFRIIAVVFIAFYLRNLIRAKSQRGLIFSISLILAGAIGNIIDSALYGVLFSSSKDQIATFMPDGGGYAGFLLGSVVDMLYFPIYYGRLPEWLPWVGGSMFEFFQPVFNLADSTITIGVASILLFQKKFFTEREKKIKDEQNEQDGVTQTA